MAASSSSAGDIEMPATPPNDEAGSPKFDVHKDEQHSASTSGLSSLSSDIGPTPKGLRDYMETDETNRTGATRAGSPVRRSKRERKQMSRYAEFRASISSTSSQDTNSLPPRKRRKTHAPGTQEQSSSASETSIAQSSSSNSVSSIPNVPLSPVQASASRPEPKLKQSVTATIPEIEADIVGAFFAKAYDKPVNRKFTLQQVDDYTTRFPEQLERMKKMSQNERREHWMYPNFDYKNPTYYGADGTISKASSSTAQPGSNKGSRTTSPLKGGRSGQQARGNRGNGKNGKSQKGRGTGGSGPGRDKESPDPPHKISMKPHEKDLLHAVRQRQLKLKSLFSSMAGQQRDALELQASGNISKLLRKPTFHTKVPAYHEVMQKLEEKENETKSLIRAELKEQIALADRELGSQAEIIVREFRTRVEEAQKEHVRGCQGDLMLIARAHRGAGDDTRTSNGSDIGSDFPRLHELPEPNARPRGYTSQRIQDEKAFRETSSSYDEQAQREVIERDIVGPVLEAAAREAASQRADVDKQARLDTLIDVARQELRQAGGYLVPRPLSEDENPQFALSRLADVAEYISTIHPNRAYIFMPVEPRDIDNFPIEYLIGPKLYLEYEQIQSRRSANSRATSLRPKSTSLPQKRPSADQTPYNKPSSNPSASLPNLAIAPSRMPPPPSSSSSQRHHSVLVKPPIAHPTFVRAFCNMASREAHAFPEVASWLQTSSQQIPRASQPPTTVAQLAPPASPASSRGSLSQPHVPPQPSPHQSRQYPPTKTSITSPIATTSPQQFQPPTTRFDIPQPTTIIQQQLPQPPLPPPSQPAITTTTISSPASDVTQQRRRSINASSFPAPRPRLGGPRREPGQITFTPAQTPDSDRFKNPPQPQLLPPGQSAYRPSSLQPHHHNSYTTNINNNNNNNHHHNIPELLAPTTTTTTGQNLTPAQGPPSTTSTSTSTAGSTTGKITNTFVNQNPDATSRSIQAADVARRTATSTQVQGAGPKGGKRVLLPKG
ncbi:hypothetical protein LTS08_004779 [Lithohypha guttulata]|nr:hypothetical protein LTS08_004779 [Lithohypha guttulata]